MVYGMAVIDGVVVFLEGLIEKEKDDKTMKQICDSDGLGEGRAIW